MQLIWLILKKKSLLDRLYKYKDASSWRDQINSYPNIEVDTEVIDNLAFFIRPSNIKEDKPYIDEKNVMCCVVISSTILIDDIHWYMG